ncbi:MAG: class I SAM-dependent methyltransferase [Deltaproteobacteria bacterium]|nr:class I SAM-dependent methyltransferase [Deltaproteobacteria bacterium]
MSRPTAEYVDDVPYIRQYVSELSPPNLRIAAGLNGLALPPDGDFDYCELGCGHGDTLCALAAAHPNARFVGVDIVGAHVANAKKLARDGALENVGLLERDFGDLVGDDAVGELDFVVAHGVLTWVSPEKRRQLLAFARAKLKPGGLLFVTYNAMPGWASVEPLRQLVVSPLLGGADPSASSIERARSGVGFAKALAGAGARYFADNPSAVTMLETMAKTELAYVVHEYLHEHWSPMYFARVAWEMAEHDLHFAGVLPAFLNFRDTAIPLSLDSTFTEVPDRITFESLKDFALNEFFRRDLYVRGSATRSLSATAAFVDGTHWCLRAVSPPAERVVSLPHRSISLEGALFDALFSELVSGAATVSALAARPSLATFGLEKVRGAMVKAILADAVLPVSGPTKLAAAPANAMYRVPSVYNQMMLRRLSSDTPLLMISTVAGTAFPISTLDALALRVLTEVLPADRPRWIRDLVGRSVIRLRVGDQVLDDPDAQARAIDEAVDRLVRHRLAKLLELGVLERVT